MSAQRKEAIHTLLKGIETGDPDAVKVVNEARYIQHNPQTEEGNNGLAALFKRISLSQPRVNIMRLFSDGDFVFGHTEYDFSTRKIGFEIFRFEGDQAVEHWDNIQERGGPNISGHSMVSGPDTAQDLNLTEENRTLVSQFVNDVLIQRDFDRLSEFLNLADFTQHYPSLSDQAQSLIHALTAINGAEPERRYDRNHRILAEGNFVLSVSEGRSEGMAASFFDLFRVQDNRITEHWSTVEIVPPPSSWKNNNGKF